MTARAWNRSHALQHNQELQASSVLSAPDKHLKRWTDFYSERERDSGM